MYFNVSQLLREPSGASRRFEVSEDLAQTEAGEQISCKGTVRLLRTDRGIWVSGELSSKAVCECSRCLNLFLATVSFTIEEEFFPEIDPVSGEAIETDPLEQANRRIDQNHVLDVGDVVSQYIATSVPMKPVCRTDCAGFCPVCGNDRNTSTCECDTSGPDARWGKLLDLVTTNKLSKN